MQISVYFPHELQRALKNISPLVEKIYLVGGAIRDALLYKASHDFDFIVKGDTIKMARNTANILKGAFFVLDDEREYGRVLFTNEEGVLYILDFTPLSRGNILDDLQARDFTINAMAVDLAKPGELIDPFGAEKDLREKNLQTCTAESFAVDPVRVLRAIRFSINLGLEIHKDTQKALAKNVASLPDVSSERKRDEIFRILEGNSVTGAVQMMDAFGMLPFIIPELVELVNFHQPPPHVMNGWEHTIKVLEYCEDMCSYFEKGAVDLNCPPALQTAFKCLKTFQLQIQELFKQGFVSQRSIRGLFLMAALYHDVGKLHAQKKMIDGRIYFVDHGRISADLAVKRGQELALANKELRWLKSVVGNHMLVRSIPLESEKVETRKAVFRFYRAAGASGIWVCLLSLADVLATYGETLTQERWGKALDRCDLLLDAWFNKQREWISPDLIYNGNDLQSKFGLLPGATLGAILEKLREAQATGIVGNQKEADRLIMSAIKADQ
ncbi:MAG TPA: HD domain-containing protein [Anaerolineae bacterium]|nr:HD domain-containing protein [Anaerolineae bacterium]